jgi:hypothetical protein
LYVCSDGLFVSIGAREPEVNAMLSTKLGLADDPDFGQAYDPRSWPRCSRSPTMARVALPNHALGVTCG